MSKTPQSDSSFQFKLREIASTCKDQHAITKTIYSHISTLHGLLDDWLNMREKGVRICKGISSLKLYECKDNYYPSQLKPLMESLLEILGSLKNITDGIRMINIQMQALVRLQPGNEAIISTWSVSEISKCIMLLFESLEKEYKLKEIITENVAHCRDEKLIEVYVSAWELETYFNIQSYSYLFAEVGLSGLS